LFAVLKGMSGTLKSRKWQTREWNCDTRLQG